MTANVLFEVNEGSTAWLTVQFYDRAGAPEIPASVTYRIWDVASSIEIVPSTSLTPGSSVEITLTSDDNRILDDTLYREARKVIVTAGFAGSETLNQDYVYHVRNIAHEALPPPN
jgi:hypothetical protein